MTKSIKVEKEEMVLQSDDVVKLNSPITAGYFKVFATRDSDVRVKQDGKVTSMRGKINIPFVETLRMCSIKTKGLSSFLISARGDEHICRALRLLRTLKKRGLTIGEIVIEIEGDFSQLKDVTVVGKFEFID